MALLEKVCQNIDVEKKETSESNMLHKEILRPPKTYYMLANRACRKSIMIGHDLN